MKYVLLTDDTRIDNCSNSTTARTIIAVGNTYAAAAAARDLITAENSATIRVYNEDGTLAETGADLILLDGAQLISSADGVLCQFSLRDKTELEKIHDEIGELQEAVIEG